LPFLGIMSDYIFAIFGLTILCSAWGLFQIWIVKHHPNTAISKSGCSTCKQADCDRKSSEP